ncbi:hypothetical protein T09_10520 [Trichinella sp. T9]|nr:hypothetical protein T09_10520 [Trichinella sp. T9]
MLIISLCYFPCRSLYLKEPNSLQILSSEICLLKL